MTLSLIGLTAILSSCVSTQPPTENKEALLPSAMGETAPQSALTSAKLEWPKQLITEGRRITIYQPQPEKWSNNLLRERAVVSVESPTSSEPVFGQIWFDARTTVDQKTQLVRFEDLKVVRATFPSDPELSRSVISALRQNSSELLPPVALKRLHSELTIDQLEAKRAPAVLSNRPPHIIYSGSPAVLVLIDGKPVLRETGEKNLLRVINTRVLMILDASNGKFYFYMGNRWMESSTLKGPWTVANNPPSSLDQVRTITSEKKQVDLLDDPLSTLMSELREGIIPKVYVSTQPAALLQTQGKPDFQSIAGTKLLSIENTHDSIFLNEADQNYYALISGRWYRSKSLNGPWSFVSAGKLPADFAKIPENHRKGGVLTSVAGTPEAQEAGIQNQVPQTARVNRRQASLQVEYDGSPEFKPVPDTSLHYAVNTVTPVIQVNPHSYYAVKKGVWFVASTPEGPWSVATSVPPVIYTIPPSSPLYYVTYVRVYDSTPDYVYVGYLPGYLGSYYASDGVVVFGTGYNYPAWIGTVWIGPPVTFGLGWGYWDLYPWWGPWWAWNPYLEYPYPYPYPYPVNTPPTGNQTNVYQGWSAQTVFSANPALFNTPYVAGTQQPGTGSWQSVAPGTSAPGISAWSPPTSSSAGAASWGTATSSEAARAQAYSGLPPSSAPGIATPGQPGWGTFNTPAPPPTTPFNAPMPGAGWGPSVSAPMPAAPAPPAAPPPAAPPPSAGAMGQSFSGKGWGGAHH